MAAAFERNSNFSVIVPADGTRAATWRTETSVRRPIFGQLSDKPLLACVWSCGVSEVKEQWRLENLRADSNQ